MRWQWVVIGLLCATFVASAAMPGGLGTIGGQVLNGEGKPVAGVHVTLQATEGGHLQATETNDQGRFWFAALPEGQYSVRASDTNRISEWKQGLWVAPGEQTNVVLHLRPKR